MPHSTTQIPRGPVTSEIVFYKAPADGATPFNYTYSPPPEGHPQRNFGEDAHQVEFTDIRGHENEYSLDRDGFAALQGVKSDTTYATFDNDEEIERVYYPEVKKLLLEQAPGKPYRVIIFDHTIRRPKTSREPVLRAHIDQTARAAAERIRLHVPEKEEVEKLLAGANKKDGEEGATRFRIINVWKPLNGPIVSSPLGVAQASTIDQKQDLVPVEHRYPHRTGETMGVKYNEAQNWIYWSGMQNDERLLLECSDTRLGLALPHTAFTDPRTPEGAKGRESIEVRTLVLG